MSFLGIGMLGNVLSKRLCRPVYFRKRPYICKFYSTRLIEVGVLGDPKLTGEYEEGQFFIHRVFQYRGVILSAWLPKVYDCGHPSKVDKAFQTIGTTSKGRTQTYYQVLLDSRDFPFISTQSDLITFLGDLEDNSLYTIPGLDHVPHEDIIPYSSTENTPLVHDFFPRFFSYDKDAGPNWVGTEDLHIWQNQNYSWLELSEVYKETTENIQVTVIPFYLGTRPSQTGDFYWWRYCIRIENLSNEPIHLRKRNWHVLSISGTLETIEGVGVIGKEPLLTKQQPAFQYSSHISLKEVSGRMWGTFLMERADGSEFRCSIPTFPLEA